MKNSKTHYVVLSSAEFLSLYTGILLSKDFKTVTDACKKVYGYNDDGNMAILFCCKSFKNYINRNRKDIVNIIKKIGDFKLDEKQDNMKQINNYIGKFETEYGNDSVIVPSHANLENKTKVDDFDF